MFEKIDENHIRCLQCAHLCTIKEGRSGFCGVNFNMDGVLINSNKNTVTALNIDPIEKKPLFHFLPGSKILSLGTSGCNFRCPFCQNYEISQDPKHPHKKVSKELLYDIAIENGCESIAFTYNEPTIFYEYAKEYGLYFKERGLKVVFVSNGFFSDASLEDGARWIDGINVDLKSNDPVYYKKVLKGDLEIIKKNLIGLVKKGVWTEITTLLIPSISLEDVKEMGKFILNELGDRVPWHISRFHPDYKMDDALPTEGAKMREALNIAKDMGIKYVYDGNVGLNLPTICPSCKSVAIKRSSFGAKSLLDKNGCCQVCGNAIEGVWS